MVGARGAYMGPRARDTVTIGPLVVPAVDMILAMAIAGPNASVPNQGMNVMPANSGSGVFGLARASIQPASLSYQGGAGAGAISYLRIEGRPNVTIGQVLMSQPGMTVPVIVRRAPHEAQLIPQSLFLARGPYPTSALLGNTASGMFTGSELCIGCQDNTKFNGRILWRQPYQWDAGPSFSPLWAVTVSGVYVGTGTTGYVKAPWCV